MSYQPGIYCYSTKHHVRTFRVSHRQSSNAKDTSLGVGADLLQLVVKFLCDAGRCITFKEIDPWVGQRYQRSGDAVLVHVTNLVVDIEVFSPNGSTCPKLMRQHQSTVQYKAPEELFKPVLVVISASSPGRMMRRSSLLTVITRGMVVLLLKIFM
jgi:hypothetical protein